MKIVKNNAKKNPLRDLGSTQVHNKKVNLNYLNCLSRLKVVNQTQHQICISAFCGTHKSVIQATEATFSISN